mgnify:CR=1 FL=1|jgi:DNA repair exonuclease SbcCD ATPase subunit
MFSINEINLLHSQNERLKQQNQDLQKENKELKNACKIERRRNANELEMSNRKLKQECEELKKYISEKEGIGDDCDYCKHNDKYNCYQNIFLDNLKEINRYKQALEPFEDEYFKGLDTKQIAELAKKSIRLTTENRKLENKLSDIAGICSQILDGEDYVRRIAKTILDIID